MSSPSHSRSLPDRPNLEQLKKQAKSLRDRYQAGDEQAVDLVQHFERDPRTERFGLQDAQRVLARSYGFASWSRLKERVILEAIKNGDAANLRQIIQDSPERHKLLTSRISDIESTNHSFGKDATLLQFASFRPWKGQDIASTLLASGAPIDIHAACGLGMTDKIRELLQASPDLINKQVDSYFPLQYAISAARTEAIECLMRLGEDANRPLKKVAYFAWENDLVESAYASWRPLHMASLWGFDASRIPVAECLIKHGADVNAVSPLDGFRPVHLVTMPNRVDLIRFYVANGAGVDSRSVECQGLAISECDRGPCSGTHDCTPLMVACGEGFIEAVECLLDLGANVHARNSAGHTPLHIADRRFWPKRPYDAIIELLLARGADKNARDDVGHSP